MISILQQGQEDDDIKMRGNEKREYDKSTGKQYNDVGFSRMI